MKKFFLRIFPFLVILFFSLFACQKLFNSQFYTSHDGEGHVIRLIEFDNALSEGQFPVRFAKRINHGLGYPYFNFNYPFIYYLGVGLHHAGFSYVTAFKALMILSVLLSGFGMYLFCKKYFSTIASLTASIFYILAPYRLLVMYVRGSVAEEFALGLLPFLFLAVELLIEKKKGSFWFFIFILSVLITAHNITAFFATPFLVLYFFLRILRKREKKELIAKLVSVILLSGMLTAFFWFPALYEAPNTKLAELTQDYKLFFPSVSEIIYSPWGFGAYLQGNVPGKMSPQIGIIHVAIAVVAIILLCFRLFTKKREEKDNLFLGFILVALICFFLLFPTSLFIWDHAFYLQLVQHPWRLVGYIIMSTSIAAAYSISCIKNKKLAMACFVIIVAILLYTTRNMIRVNMYVPFRNPFDYSQVYGPSTTSKDEHMPRLAPRVYQDPNPNGDLIASTSGTVKRIVWRSTYHKFIVHLSKAADLRDNTSYFPGWKGYVDGRQVPLLYITDEFYRLRVHVPKGNHIVEFKYSEIWYRLIADILSLLTLFSIVVILVVVWIKQKSSKKFQKKLKTAPNVKKTK
ncbi:MAG: 6-pyruvoyl-tetrahydropterin synthase-related protein [Candidatus Levyibacteriota bacterium]